MQEPLLEKMTFEFSQDGNINSHKDQSESLIIECDSSLGIDRDEGCFFTLKTEGWSIDSIQELESLFNRIRKIIKK